MLNNTRLPLITIITPVFSGERDIADCIQSVANQTYKNIEHIIIDGKSKDNTVSIIKKLQKQYSHIFYLSEQDDGIYDAMNKGIKLSKGDYLYFLGSDDLFFDNCVLENIFGNNLFEKFDFIYGRSFYKFSRIEYGKEFELHEFKNQNINHQSIFYRKSIFEKIGYYNLKYNIAADWIFNINCFLDNNISKLYLENLISIYNDNGLSNSNARDYNFQRDYLLLFPSLSFKDICKCYYFRIKPKWFNPTLFFKRFL